MQKRPAYDQEGTKCEWGCGQVYHERRDQHFLAFHENKTWALICGCGFGEIAANRFRIYLDLVHGQKRDVEEISDEYYFNNLPEHITLKTCFNEKYKGHCKFRTPYLNLSAVTLVQRRIEVLTPATSY